MRNNRNTNTVFFETFEEVYDSIQRRIARFDPISIFNYLIFIDYVSMILYGKDEELKFIQSFKISPWHVQPLLAIYFLTDYINRPNRLDVFKSQNAFNKIAEELANGEALLLSDIKNDITIKLHRFIGIQDSYRDRIFPLYFYHYDYLMQDIEAQKWFKNEFGFDYRSLLVMNEAIKMLICSVLDNNESAVNDKITFEIINVFLKEYEHVYKKYAISIEDYRKRQLSILIRWNYNFYNMPLVLEKNPFVEDNGRITVNPKYILSFFHDKIDYYYINRNSGRDLGNKLEDFFGGLINNYKYATKQWRNRKKKNDELFDLALTDGTILVCLDIKSVSIFNNIYEIDNEKIIGKIYKYVKQRFKSVKSIVDNNINFDGLKFKKEDIYSFIVFKDDRSISKGFVLENIEAKIKEDGFADMIEYFKNNCFITDYSSIYEYLICDCNIFDDIKNRKSNEYISSKRISDKINCEYDEWYDKLLNEAKDFLVEKYNCLYSKNGKGGI